MKKKTGKISTMISTPQGNLDRTMEYLSALDQKCDKPQEGSAQITKKIFKAEVHITHMLELPGVEKFGIQLPKTILITAQDREDCVNKLTARIDRYTKKSYDLAHPYKTRVIIVVEIAIHELTKYTTASEHWTTFFRWQAGGNYLSIYHAPFLKSKYREHKNNKGEFSNL